MHINVHLDKCSSLRSLIFFNPLCILSLIHWIHYWLCIEYICRTKTRPANLYPLPNIGAGKRVPFQSLPHSKETNRNCSCAVPHWTSDQNLVPKPSHEVEERKQIETGWWGWIRRFAPRVSVISDSAAMMPLKCPPFWPPLLPPLNESFWQKCFLNPPCKQKWLLFHYLNLNWACSQNLEYSLEKNSSFVSVWLFKRTRL